MSRSPQPYIKCQKLDGVYHLTLMRSNGRHLLLAGRDTVPIGDSAALQTCVKDMIIKARLAEQKVGIQADGNS